MKKVYFLSGLGADHRLFCQQVFEDIELTILPWIPPLNEDEPLESYAKRLAEPIRENGPVIVGGVSFGGMMALEISKIIKTEKVILISSISKRNELPLHIRIVKYLPVYKWLPPSLIKKSGLILKFVFGKTTKEEGQLLKNMLNDSSDSFIKWAIHQIVNWNNTYIPKNLVRIHGTSDLTFPLTCIKDRVIKIDKGSHVMIMTASEEINPLLRKIIIENT